MGASPDYETGRFERRDVTAAAKSLATPQQRYASVPGARWAFAPQTVRHDAITEAATQAYYRIRDDRAWDRGHGGYTGTFAEKPEVHVVKLRENLTKRQWATLTHMVEEGFASYDWETEKTTYRKPTGPESTVMKKLGLTVEDVTELFRTFDEKWGPSLMLVTPDRRFWVGGWCSS